MTWEARVEHELPLSPTYARWVSNSADHFIDNPSSRGGISQISFAVQGNSTHRSWVSAKNKQKKEEKKDEEQ